MEVSGQCHAPAAFPLEEKPITHCIGGWVDPWVSLDILEGIKVSCSCWDSNPWIVQPIA